jgi:hypothetical protein
MSHSQVTPCESCEFCERREDSMADQSPACACRYGNRLRRAEDCANSRGRVVHRAERPLGRFFSCSFLVLPYHPAAHRLNAGRTGSEACWCSAVPLQDEVVNSAAIRQPW